MMKGFFCYIYFLPLTIFSATFQVTNTQNTGPGSLAFTITQANNHIAPDTIEFNIPTSDANYNGPKKFWAITLTTTLPPITDDGTFINGSSQRLNSGIENLAGKELAIQGTSLPPEEPGFVIYSSGNTFIDFSIGGFRGITFDFVGDSVQNNTIKSCYIGISADGKWGYNIKDSQGIRFLREANNNTIGGPLAEDMNIISGFNDAAVLIEKSGYNKIIGNIFGLGSDGLKAIGNGWQDFDVFEPGKPARGGIASILLRGQAYHNTIGGKTIGERNIICAAGRAGIRIESVGSDSNIIQGNYIGVADDGETAIPNGEAGIQIANGASYNQIGGTEQGAGNVVSSNWSSGIQLRNNIMFNKVQGNFIGTNAAGTAIVANSHNGIYIFGSLKYGYPTDNEIGPGNIIIANAEEDLDEKYGFTWGAVRFDSSGTTRNMVHGNWIGTNKDGSLTSLLNSGVIVGGGAHHNQIGPDNVIANNAKWGIWVRQENTSFNTLTQNKVYGNGWGAIVLEKGGNNLLDPPLITANNENSISGKAVSNGLVELFRSISGQADEYIGTAPADENGDFVWNGEVSTEDITATFTDSDGNTSALSLVHTVPVELAFFNASVSGNTVYLEWTTESETNNLGFYVEREFAEGTFADIGYIKGNGTSNNKHEYSYTDETAVSGVLSYRLRQVDMDGTVHYSKPITVNILVPKNFNLSLPYPNPFNSTTVITFDLPSDQNVELFIYNVLGRKIKTLADKNIKAGSYKLHWNGKNDSGLDVPSGQYFVTLIGENERQVRRVLLLK
jgi:hypothetical protein